MINLIFSSTFFSKTFMPKVSLTSYIFFIECSVFELPNNNNNIKPRFLKAALAPRCYAHKNNQQSFGGLVSFISNGE